LFARIISGVNPFRAIQGIAMKKARKYQLPDFLYATPLKKATLDQAAYERWLHGRAVAHVRRDKKRGNTTATNETYKIAIHEAVIRSGGHDHYTGEELCWSLVGQYSNEESKAKKTALQSDSGAPSVHRSRRRWPRRGGF
jgi:hypothetical protein